MQGLELITGNSRLNILQCQEFSKDIGFDKCEFDLCGPKGKLRCRWLDAYFGMFCVVGKEDNGFMMSKELQFNPDVWCENVGVSTADNKSAPTDKQQRHAVRSRKSRKAATSA